MAVRSLRIVPVSEEEDSSDRGYGLDPYYTRKEEPGVKFTVQMVMITGAICIAIYLSKGFFS